MKRIVGLFLTLIVLTAITSCGKQDFAFEEERLKSLSQECMNRFIQKDFAGVENMVKRSSRSKLSAATLQQAWQQTGEKVGAFVRFVSADVSVNGKNATVILVSAFEQNGMTATFSFDTNYEIKALYMNYKSIVGALNIETEAYTQQEIKIGGGEEPLTGALTLPKGTRNPPVVVFVHGSGATDLNESVGAADNRPFEDLAYGLARQGVASIRYDKRNYAYPDTFRQLGKQVTIQDETLNDVNSAVAYAQSLASVDTSRIYVLGHSLGGMLAPKIAQDNPAVAGLVIMAGSPRRLEDIVYDQNKMLLDQTQQSQSQKDRTLREIEAEVQKIKQLKKGASPDMIFNMPAAYWISLNEIDTESIAKNLSIPMLIQQGSADFQVSAEKDYPLWQQVLAGKDNVRFRLYDGLNHLFMQNNGKQDTTEYDSKGQVDQNVIDDIGAFIRQH